MDKGKTERSSVSKPIGMERDCLCVCVCVRGGSLVNIYRIEEIFPWGDRCVSVG